MSTTQQVRLNLMETLIGLRNGTVTPAQAKETTKTASAINQSIRFDIENKRENIKLMKAVGAKKYKELEAKPLGL